MTKERPHNAPEQKSESDRKSEINRDGKLAGSKFARKFVAEKIRFAESIKRGVGPDRQCRREQQKNHDQDEVGDEPARIDGGVPKKIERSVGKEIVGGVADVLERRTLIPL
jgi:hypothetical protein